MNKKPVDMTKAMESDQAERIADRLAGELSETDEKVWGEDFAASGDPKNPQPSD